MDERLMGFAHPRLAGPLLDHLAWRVRTEAESTLDEFGVRPRQVIALTLLRDFGERGQSDLAAILVIDPTNLVGILNELESNNLVERRRSTADRRRHTVAITEAGAALLDEIADALAASERKVLSGLDSDQQSALYDLLRAAAGNVTCSE